RAAMRPCGHAILGGHTARCGGHTGAKAMAGIPIHAARYRALWIAAWRVACALWRRVRSHARCAGRRITMGYVTVSRAAWRVARAKEKGRTIAGTAHCVLGG